MYLGDIFKNRSMRSADLAKDEGSYNWAIIQNSRITGFLYFQNFWTYRTMEIPEFHDFHISKTL